MGITESDLRNASELIQDDLITLLDGLDQKTIDNACNIIVDRFESLIYLTDVEVR
jgi:hypothetical protein